MENENIRRYNTIGWVVMIVGILIFTIGLIYVFYNYEAGVRLNSMTNIAQIVATLISIGGLFFVLDNLVLQRITLQKQQTSISQQQTSLDIQREDLKLQHEELKTSNEYFKQQNEAFLKQQYETTFFKLLENHNSLSKLIRFYDGGETYTIDSYYKFVTEKIDDYRHYLATQRIKSTNIAKYYPPYIISYNYESFNQLYQSILHLMAHVEEKLNGEMFFHKTLYNSLNTTEKYFFGLFFYNSKEEININFIRGDVNYLQLFEKSLSFYNKDYHGFIPSIKITQKTERQNDLPNNELLFKKTEFSVFRFYITVFDLNNEKDISITSVKLFWKKYNGDESEVDVLDYKMSGFVLFDIKADKLFQDTIVKDYLHCLTVYSGPVHITNFVYRITVQFNCMYLGVAYNYEKYYTLGFNNNTNSKSVSILMNEVRSH